VRFAALTHDLGKATTPADVLPRHIGHEGRSVDLLKPLCDRLRVPNECRDLAVLVAREHGNIHRVMETKAAGLVRLFERSDALRKPARFAEALQACEADARGRLGPAQRRRDQARLRHPPTATPGEYRVKARCDADFIGAWRSEAEFPEGYPRSGPRASVDGGIGAKRQDWRHRVEFDRFRKFKRIKRPRQLEPGNRHQWQQRKRRDGRRVDLRFRGDRLGSSRHGRWKQRWQWR